MRISIAIPTYGMGGVGHRVIVHALESLLHQSFTDFEVVISDQSEDDLTQNTCAIWSKVLNIVYVKETQNRGFFTANTNNAIKHCSGEIIKFLDADDFLYHPEALKVISDNFSDDDNWMATDYVHTEDRINFFKRHSPSMNPHIYVVNTIGTPSCVAIRNNNPPLFDENLRWAGDCEYYKQLYDRWGEPKIINDITVVHYLWPGQVENTFGSQRELQDKENAYIINKYGGDHS